MVVDGSALLSVGEGLELWVVCSQALPREEGVTVFLCVGLEVALENFPAPATLLLADVSSVRVPKEEHSHEAEGKIALSTVVESVGLVPVRELTRVLLCQRGLFAWDRWTFSTGAHETTMQMLDDDVFQLFLLLTLVG